MLMHHHRHGHDCECKHSPKQQQRRRHINTYTTCCKNGSLFLWMVLIFLGLATVFLNILYVRLHLKYNQTTTSTTAATAHSGKQRTRVDKKGRVVHRSISTVHFDDYGLSDDALPPYNASLSDSEAIVGRQFLVDLLYDAGVTEVDSAVLQRLPTLDTIRHLYGGSSSREAGPTLVGQETCATFRHAVPARDRFLGVAGLFNTGTNLMSSYLEANCRIVENPNRNRGMKWQVPWGKHMMAKFKWTNVAKKEERSNKKNVLPVVVVRDPYSWMQSMCRLHYAVSWHTSKAHCPNLVPNDEDFKLYPHPNRHVPVRLNFKGRAIGMYDSLAHLWTDWYRQYLEADYPRIVVRYEDLMYYPKQVTSQLCECVGGRMEPEFVYMIDSAKWGPGHGATEGRTSLVAAMIKYGNVKKRLRGYTEEDLQLAHVGLDENMMELFQYNQPLLDRKQLSLPLPSSLG